MRMESPLAAWCIDEQPYYQPAGREVELFEAACLRRMPVMLKGPTGCGKTRLVEYMAWRLGKPLITVACSLAPLAGIERSRRRDQRCSSTSTPAVAAANSSSCPVSVSPGTSAVSTDKAKAANAAASSPSNSAPSHSAANRVRPSRNQISGAGTMAVEHRAHAA